MEYIDFLTLRDFLNPNNYVNKSLQDEMKDLNMNEFDFDKIWSIDWKI